MKVIFIIVVLLAAAFLLGCQVSDRLGELAAESAAAESPEEGEIAEGLDELDDFNTILDEDINDLEEFEDLELE